MRKFRIALLVLALGPAGPAVAADAAALAAGCDDCHGPDGVSAHGEVPTIAGQTADFISDALRSFQIWGRPCIKSSYRHGDTSRPKTDMCGIVEDLSDEDLEAVAAWYSGKTFVPAAQEFDAALAEAGSALHADNCENCHGEGGSLAGVGPRLAGQWIPYLKSTLKYVPTGEHQVPSMMERKLNEFSPDEMQALLNYYAGQQD